jgi:hypothetical protein
MRNKTGVGVGGGGGGKEVNSAMLSPGKEPS